MLWKLLGHRDSGHSARSLPTIPLQKFSCFASSTPSLSLLTSLFLSLSSTFCLSVLPSPHSGTRTHTHLYPTVSRHECASNKSTNFETLPKSQSIAHQHILGSQSPSIISITSHHAIRAVHLACVPIGLPNTLKRASGPWYLHHHYHHHHRHRHRHHPSSLTEQS